MRRDDQTRNVLPGHDAETAAARTDAHLYFDPLWMFGLMSRSEAYAELAKAMGIAPHRCHIAMMTKEQALSVRGHAADIRRNWKRGEVR